MRKILRHKDQGTRDKGYQTGTHHPGNPACGKTMPLLHGKTPQHRQQHTNNHDRRGNRAGIAQIRHGDQQQHQPDHTNNRNRMWDQLEQPRIGMAGS
eukprot:10504749-Heterocapsa_arctica.AAC.1